MKIEYDYRAIYEEMIEGEDTVAYFVILGTHEQIYRKYRQLPES